MKGYQPRPEFELVSPCPFPTTITIIRWTLYIYIKPHKTMPSSPNQTFSCGCCDRATLSHISLICHLRASSRRWTGHLMIFLSRSQTMDEWIYTPILKHIRRTHWQTGRHIYRDVEACMMFIGIENEIETIGVQFQTKVVGVHFTLMPLGKTWIYTS